MRWKGSKDGRKEEYKRILRYRKGYGGIGKDKEVQETIQEEYKRIGRYRKG